MTPILQLRRDRVRVAFAVGVSSLALFGCARFRFAMGMPNWHVGPADTRLKPVAYRLAPEPPRIDPILLTGSEFYPVGATRLVAEVPLPGDLVATEHAAFPSDVVCTSPDRKHRLFSGTHKYDFALVHYLYRADAGTDRVQVLYSSPRSFGVLWSPDSRSLALEVSFGANNTSVVVADADRGEQSGVLYPSEVLDRTFSEVERASAQQIVARGWTDRGDLLLRGVGVTPTEPYVLFGYEVLVSDIWTVPHYQLLRAYRKRLTDVAK